MSNSNPATISDKRSRSLVGGLVMLVALAAFMLWFEMDSPLLPGRAMEACKPTETRNEALHIKLDLVQLLMGWALAIIGGTAFFLKLNIEKALRMRMIDLVLVLAIIEAAVLSLFFGHLEIDRTSMLLAACQDPLQEHTWYRIGQFQYLSFFLSVLLFGLHVYQFFWARMNVAVPTSTGESQ